MAKSAKQRQAEYRARRKSLRLCAYPGCDRKPRKYTLCPGHREDARDQARDRTLMAGMYEDALADRDQWRARATALAVNRYSELSDSPQALKLMVSELGNANQKLKARVSDLEYELAEANRRKAGYLPEGLPGSIRLRPAEAVRVGIVA